jgi:hypothetical protein
MISSGSLTFTFIKVSNQRECDKTKRCNKLTINRKKKKKDEKVKIERRQNNPNISSRVTHCFLIFVKLIN